MGARNPEFCKVMDILKDDMELRPLIFEHEMLLQALLPVDKIKAEVMLSILTAAETEMFENSRQREETAELNDRLGKVGAERDQLKAELKRVTKQVSELQAGAETYAQERDALL